jgi:hypothetical protein
MAQKPALFSEDNPTDLRFDPWANEGQLDPGRIEGYSEIIKANDIAKADDLTFREQNMGRTKEDLYKQIGAAPRKLKYEFAWLPVSGAAGGAISQAASQQLDWYMTREGFRLASLEEVQAEGFRIGPSAHVAADGTIRRGPDVALYLRSGEVARKWERYRAEKAAQAEGAKLPERFEDGDFATETFVAEEERTRTTLGAPIPGRAPNL